MTDYPVDGTQLTIYLVFTLLSILTSLIFYIYFMECSDIQKADRDEYNTLIYHFINERDSVILTKNDENI